MTLKLNGSTSGSVSIDAPASTTGGADVALTLPVNDGDANQFLQTNGSGVLSFAGVNPGRGAFNAYADADQDFTQNNTAKCQFNAERFDVDSWYDHSTNYRYTPQIAGYYQFNVNTKVTSGSDNSEIVVFIYKNGSNVRNIMNSGNGYGGYIGTNISSIIQMNGSSDYVEVYLKSDDVHNGTRTMKADTNSEFSGFLVYPT